MKRNIYSKIVGFTVIFLLITSYSFAAGLVYYANPAAADQGAVGVRTVKSLATAIGATKKATIVLAHSSSGTNTTYTFNTSVAITSNISLKIENGALATIATTQTLTINGPFEAGLYQVFSYTGTGKVVLGGGIMVLPEWWGAVGNGTDDDTAEINAALGSITTSHGGVIFQPGRTYGIQDTYIQVNNGVREINGNGATLKVLDTETTSVTSAAIGTGAKSFTVEAAKSFNTGMNVDIVSAADSDNKMHGTVTSYDAGTGALVVDVVSVGGSGTYADWLFSAHGTGILLIGKSLGSAQSITENVKYLNLHHLTIDHNGQPGNGIWGDCISYCNIHDNRIINLKNAVSTHGILVSVYFSPDSTENATENKIVNNTIVHTGVQASSTGISIDSVMDWDTHGNMNDYWRAHWSIPEPTYANFKTVVSGNSIYQGYYGISTSAAKYCTIEGNILDANVRNMSIQNNSNYNTIVGNVCRNSTSSAIHVATGSSHNVIAENTIHNTENSGGESLLQAYLGATYNLFIGNNTFASDATGPDYHLYCALESSGNSFINNILRGTAHQAYIGVESAWDSLITVIVDEAHPIPDNPSHHGEEIDKRDGLAHASMGWVTIQGNKIVNSSAVPAIYLAAIDIGAGTYDLTSIKITDNTVYADIADGHQLKIFEKSTATVNNTILQNNAWVSSAVAADFSLARGQAHFRTISGNSPGYVEGYSNSMMRQSNILIEDGTDAAHIKVTMTSELNGDANAVQDNIGKDDVTTGVWSLNAEGLILTLLTTGITGDPVSVQSCNSYYNTTGAAMNVYGQRIGTSILLNFYNAATGAPLDIATIIDTGKRVNLIINYRTSL